MTIATTGFVVIALVAVPELVLGGGRGGGGVKRVGGVVLGWCGGGGVGCWVGIPLKGDCTGSRGRRCMLFLLVGDAFAAAAVF